MPPRTHPGTSGKGDGSAKRVPRSLLRPPFAGCSHLVAGVVGCRGGWRVPVTCQLSPWEPPIPLFVAKLPAACLPASPPRPGTTGDETASSRVCLAGPVMCQILHPPPTVPWLLPGDSGKQDGAGCNVTPATLRRKISFSNLCARTDERRGVNTNEAALAKSAE